MSRALLSFAQLAVDRALRLDPQAGSILAPLHGKRIGVEVTAPIPLQVTVEFAHDRVFISPVASEHGAQVAASFVDGTDNGPGNESANVAVSVRGSASSLLRLARGGHELPSSAHVSVDGDIALLQQVRMTLSRLRLDFEEPLARVLGDELAYPLSRAARKVASASRRAARELGDDVQEFLAEESQLLVADDAVQDFAEQVDRLRDALARLDKRVSRAAKKLDSATP